ncbi:MAG: hypothetical protein QOF84_5719 [Streptomyces sp.]|nr:hypothetical protein [Streptomyces sp.]
MTHWEWEYLPDAEHVIGGLAPQLQAQIEVIANRLTDAAGVKYLGDPPAEESGVSKVQDFAEGRWIVWYQEHRRHGTLYILRVQHFGD